MNIIEKRKRILRLKSMIDKLEFKAKANILKAKYNNNDVSTTLALAWENVNLSIQIRMLQAQIQVVIAIPTHKKCGVTHVGNYNKSEVKN